MLARVAIEGLRKVVTVVEDVLREGGEPVEPPTRMVAVAAVVENPFAGRFVADLQPLVDRYCEPLGEILTARALDLLATPAEGVGKGALVGLDGEIEHGSAIIHNLRFGNHVRAAIGGTALLPAAEKRGVAGAPLDIAVKHKDDHTVRSHHQTFEVRVPDAPCAGEIVIWLALASGGRPQSRLAAFGSELTSPS